MSFRQECDRCNNPNKVAVTQCYDCAYENYKDSKDGQTEKTYKVCMACDKIIHEISYKQKHKRIAYVPPIHKNIHSLTNSSS